MISELLDRLMADRPELLGQVSEARRELSRHEQAEAQLAALNDAARELTRTRDVERTLQTVVDQTHRLLGSDVAYLSARTVDDDHFEVRAWAGPLSPAMRGIRVSAGTGLGGQIAITRRPLQVKDYLESTQFSHSDYLDAKMAAEGMVALLGVPLEVDRRILGILFVARRRPEGFLPAQVDLMTSLAAHAAVALDNAMLFHNLTRAVADLKDASAVVHAHALAVENAAEVHAQLTSILLRRGGIPAVLETLGSALGASVTLLDDIGKILGQAGPEPPQLPFSADVRKALKASQDSGRAQDAKSFDPRHWYVSTASDGRQQLGAVVIAAPSELSDIDRLTLDRATQTIALSLLADIAAAEAAFRVEGDALRRILDDSQASSNEVRILARRRGIDHGGLTVAVAPADSPRLQHQLAAVRALCDEVGGVGAHNDGRLVALIRLPAEAALERFAACVSAGDDSPVSIAATWAENGHGFLTGAYEEARRSLDLLGHLGRSGEHITTDQLALYSLLLPQGSATVLDHFLRRTIGPLMEHDSRHSTSLRTTALAYLDSASNLRRTAAALGIHVNTVAQRLNRIDRVLGADWREAHRRVDIHHALRLASLRGST